MQRSKSAVDFTNLPGSGVHLDSKPSFSSQGDAAMSSASVAVIKPNGPLPGAQPSEAANELPRPYKCPLCDKAFHRLEHQTRHIRTHTGEKPHACQYPGCTKKFSRSDELTRHSRIHSNPNSRRGNKAQQHHHQHIHHHHQGLPPHMLPDSMMTPSVPHKAIRSAPTSTIGSPNVSPPHSHNSFAQHPHHPAAIHPYSHRPGEGALLAKAATQVERETLAAPANHTARLYGHGHGHGLHNNLRGHVNGLSSYHIARSHSNDDHDDHYHGAVRHIKRSRPNSPNSTAPSSPTFSHESLSPTPDRTPDHTPLATPAHSPRIRPLSAYPPYMSMAPYELPSLRNLTINGPSHTPALPPMEPHLDTPQYHPQVNAPRSNGISLTDIISRPDGAQRKLPVPQPPKVAVQDLLADSFFPTSGRSSATGSLAGGDLMDRV